MKRLDRKFFERDTATVAQELIGKVLVRRIGGTTLSGLIVETEAYVGPHDLASHASKGRTQRTETMFGPAGRWYVYLVYGYYHCLNVVTEDEGYPAAVLIRAVEPLEGIEAMRKNRQKEKPTELASGPGKLCQAFGIGKGLNGLSAIGPDGELFIEDRSIRIDPRMIRKARRIGVDYAGQWKDRLLRFYLKGNPNVSKTA